MNKDYIKSCLDSLGECLMEVANTSNKEILTFDVIKNRISDALTYLQMIRSEING